jgi:hypothetical protein
MLSCCGHGDEPLVSAKGFWKIISFSITLLQEVAYCSQRMDLLAETYNFLPPPRVNEYVSQ